MNDMASRAALIRHNLEELQKRLGLCSESSPYHQSVRLIAVSKWMSVQDILYAYEAGQRDFGENYVSKPFPSGPSHLNG